MQGGHVITILCPLSLQPVISFLSFTRCGTFSAIMAIIKPLKFSGETTKTNFVEVREASDTLDPWIGGVCNVHAARQFKR